MNRAHLLQAKVLSAEKNMLKLERANVVITTFGGSCRHLQCRIQHSSYKKSGRKIINPGFVCADD